MLGIFLLACVGLLFWSVQHNKALAEKEESKILKTLSADDIKTIIQSQAASNPQALAALKNDPAQRKDILENLKSLLAEAAEARRVGIADEPEMKSQLELAQKVLLARAFDEQQSEGKPGPPFGYITPEEVEKFNADPKHAADFTNAIELQKKAMKAGGQPVPDLDEETLKRAKESFAKISLAAEKAVEKGVDKERATELQIKLQEAVILAREYATKNLTKEVEPTKDEINAYLAAHPEYDTKKQREKAESVLARAKAGEDFAKLAGEFSEDPGSKAKGGLYEGITQGSFVPEFETAALAVNDGELVPNLVESKFGYHIIKLESKKTEKDKDGKETTTFNVRHILIQTQFPDPSAQQNPFAPPKTLSAEDIAKKQVGQEKQKKLVDEIVARNGISVPDDFTVDVPPGAENAAPQGFPGMPPGMQPPPPNGKANPVGKPAPPQKKP